jgi:hypothetical protein
MENFHIFSGNLLKAFQASLDKNNTILLNYTYYGNTP